MSTDFIAGLSTALLNKAAASVFGAVQSAFSGSFSVSGLNATMDWSLSAAPTFDLSAASAETLTLQLPLSLTLTPKGGTASTASATATATCRILISLEGAIGFGVQDVTFTSHDPVAQAALDALKPQVTTKADTLMQTIEIPLGRIDRVMFTWYAAGVNQGALFAGGGLAPPVDANAGAVPRTGFSLVMTEAMFEDFVNNCWWNCKKKHEFSKQDVDMKIESYTASVSSGKLKLTLKMSGTYHMTQARWKVQIGKHNQVVVTMPFAIVDGNKIALKDGNVSMGNVNLDPDNSGAIVAGLKSSEMFRVIHSIIAEDMFGAIRENLAHIFYTVKPVPENFFGKTIKVTPTGLAIQGQGSSLLVTGDADISMT